jgi:hypothetical protein
MKQKIFILNKKRGKERKTSEKLMTVSNKREKSRKTLRVLKFDEI